MRYLLLLLLAVTLPGIGQATCGDTDLPRARFAMAIADREPVGDVLTSVPSDHDFLFFFVEVTDGAGQTLRHRWYRNDELVAEIKLAIGGNRWRTWSRKRLGSNRNVSWRVEVVDTNDCVLVERTLSANGRLPVLDQARSLLDAGDLVGARLLVKTEMANNIPYRQRLEQFLDRDLAIAQLAEQLEQQQLYTAEARLHQLQQQRLSNAQQQQLIELADALEQQRSELASAVRLSLATADRVLRRTLNGGHCPDSESEILGKLAMMPQADQLLVSGWSRHDGVVEISVIDQRTGIVHALAIDCLPWQVNSLH